MGIELDSASKSCHMGGFRVGWALGHPDVIAALARVKGAVDFNPYLGVQRALIAALARPRAAARRDALVFAGRRRVLTDAMAGAGWPAPTPSAGMYVRLALVRDDAVLRGAAAPAAGFLTASS